MCLLVHFVFTFNLYSSPCPDPPNVTTLEPLELIVNHTQNATFVCEAYGIPIPVITWVKVVNESIVTESSGVIDIMEQIVRINTSESVLTFLDTVKTDESVYRCEGSNGITNVIGSPENDTVRLLVQGKCMHCVGMDVGVSFAVGFGV